MSFDREPLVSLDPIVIREVRRYVDEIDNNLDAGKGIWFVGDPGTGKTSTAMLISRTAIEAHRTVAVYSLPRLVSVLRRAISDESGVLDFIERLVTVDLLHIDDIGSAYRADRERQRADADPNGIVAPEGGYSDWVLEQIYLIINTRYEDQRSLLLTTNLGLEDLESQFGSRIVSRIIEMCGDPLPMFGHDRRREFDPTL